MSATQSKPLTFAELEVGDHFISFPLDGDDSGHGGYRNGSYVFKKTGNEQHVVGTASPVNAKRLVDGCGSHMPEGMKVCKVFV